MLKKQCSGQACTFITQAAEHGCTDAGGDKLGRRVARHGQTIWRNMASARHELSAAGKTEASERKLKRRALMKMLFNV